MRKRTSLYVVGALLFVSLLGFMFREEAILGKSPKSEDNACGFSIGIAGNEERPDGGFCYTIDGTAYGWPSKAFAFAQWKYTSDWDQITDEPIYKMGYKWKFYITGIILDFGIVALVAAPFIYHEVTKQKSKKK